MALYDIVTSQQGIHPDLEKIVKKHQLAPYQRPVSESLQKYFQQTKAWLGNHPVILDSGCGCGMSTQLLATQFPQHKIIGIDKSIHRLAKAPTQNANFIFVPGNLIDFWTLASQEHWQIDYHYLLYPNPWPKKKHLLRRWHGHPIFPTLLGLGETLIVRSNWLTYLKEFATGASLLDCNIVQQKAMRGDTPLTHFERKYWANKVTTYELILKSSRMRAYDTA